MENLLMLSSDEHKVLKKFKTRLEKHHHIIINMPDTDGLSESDVIFVSIVGEKCNTENVKKFLSQKMKTKKEKLESQKSVVLITISDSEDSSNVSSDSESKENSVCVVEEHASSNNYPKLVKKSSLGNSRDNSICIIDYSENSPKSPIITLQNVEDGSAAKKSSVCNPLDNSICICDGPEDFIKTSGMTHKNGGKRKRKFLRHRSGNKRARIKDILTANETEVCEVSSTTEEIAKKAQLASEKLADFIPLGQEKDKKKMSEDECSVVKKKSDVILLEEPASAPRPLRPVVIDGSNVAMEHGKVSHCFSAKGIQLAVEYFLKRGHTDVHAFVPKFRRISNPHHNFPTKDPEILDELAKKQHVVFTPSRRVNGKCIASYDDRFIVDLASRNGGVIVSNDNYRDLIGESDSFKESIEKRLLMFCFVGDIFMIPSDPLGRNGPTLEEFLSFPPEGKT